jgi:opacity protein-like surface antigen
MQIRDEPGTALVDPAGDSQCLARWNKRIYLVGSTSWYFVGTRMARMRGFVFLATAAASLSGSVAAQPPSRAYVSLGAGYVAPTRFSYASCCGVTDGGLEVRNEVDGGLQIQAAIGTSLAAGFRSELAVAHSKSDLSSRSIDLAYNSRYGQETAGEVSVTSLDLNGYYDFAPLGPVQPYVGAGVGVAQLSIEDGAWLDGDTFVLNLQAMVGGTIEISPRSALFAEMRYQRPGKVHVETTGGFVARPTRSDFQFEGASLLAGVRLSL